MHLMYEQPQREREENLNFFRVYHTTGTSELLSGIDLTDAYKREGIAGNPASYIVFFETFDSASKAETSQK